MMKHQAPPTRKPNGTVHYGMWNGMNMLENANLMVPGPPRIVKRSWFERLFTRPWRPLLGTHIVPTMIPDPNFYVVDSTIFGGKTIVSHPETLRRVRDSLHLHQALGEYRNDFKPSMTGDL